MFCEIGIAIDNFIAQAKKKFYDSKVYKIYGRFKIRYWIKSGKFTGILHLMRYLEYAQQRGFLSKNEVDKIMKKYAESI